MNCYDYRKKVSSMAELQFSEATLVNVPLDDQATNTVEALAASLLISFHVGLSGPLPDAQAAQRHPTYGSGKQTQSL